MTKDKKQALTIGWLYPELMSTYGDRGNIIVLQKRCEWRDITVTVKRLDIGYLEKDLNACDLLFMGGAQDQQQKIVAKDLREKAKTLETMIEEHVPGLYICGAYQFLGKYYKEADGTVIDGLGILDLYTEHPGLSHERLIGNIVIESSLIATDKTIVGFENHGGRTYLGEKVKPLGTVTIGYGNNGEDKTEGARYKNSFGSYLHGPILPKNPNFADHLIKRALEKKYANEVSLKSLEDDLELQTHTVLIQKLQNL